MTIAGRKRRFLSVSNLTDTDSCDSVKDECTKDDARHSFVASCSPRIRNRLSYDRIIYPQDVSTRRCNSTRLPSEDSSPPNHLSLACAAMLPDDLRYKIYHSALGLVLRDGARGRVHRQLLEDDIFLTVVDLENWDGEDYLGAIRIPALIRL
uniref:Uncharacterized protein n=1 Tax=Odontella aurita TaxID=265563 RepID=A0A7S4JEL6_9STRA|mmetsp:Transcript_450/g.1361  ORF Transcript_450/g.1361 Transcript_450/m.1361 type:complete len:152 (+) Transcript_450:180-635(+)